MSPLKELDPARAEYQWQLGRYYGTTDGQLESAGSSVRSPGRSRRLIHETANAFPRRRWSSSRVTLTDDFLRIRRTSAASAHHAAVRGEFERTDAGAGGSQKWVLPETAKRDRRFESARRLPDRSEWPGHVVPD